MSFQTVLKEIFGFDKLHDFQSKVITSMLKDENIVVISPTGSGKSLCFQLPALLYEGITIVLSPLKSLIYDQVESLKSKGVTCELLNGDLGVRKKATLFDELKKKCPRLKLLYTTPEMLLNNEETMPIIKDLYNRKLISRIVLDEAHCISTWGHDFRPNYLKVKYLKNHYPDVPIIALTATATEKVFMDIKDILGLDEKIKYFNSSFLRTNLKIEIRQRGEKLKEKKETISEISEMLNTKYKGQTGLMYAFSRNECEKLSEMLQEEGIKADFYHAGLSSKKRNEIQEKWINNELQIICATIAFGMGIDKSDVRVVYHFNVPKNIEGYYQEIGRGGRDGKICDCILYYNISDQVKYNQMNNKKKTEIKEKGHCFFRDKKMNIAENEARKLYDMVGFIENEYDCRHIVMCNYFGEKRKEKIGFCGDLCDNCIRLKTEGAKDKIDMSKESKDILEYIGRKSEEYIYDTNKDLILKRLIGYPKKKPKKKLKKEFNGNKSKYETYKAEFGRKEEEINDFNLDYRNREKQMRRLIMYLISNKFMKPNVIKNEKGTWIETFRLYKKSMKVIEGSKKIII
jgi:bloom syndrome protein